MKFAMFFMAEYAEVFAVSALAATVFLGGYAVPGLSQDPTHPAAWLAALQVVVMLVKTMLFVVFFMVVRWSLSRLRYDQLMRLGWKVMLPLALLNTLVTGALLPLFR
jgi:NADH-quinone oxidoreductase subunit H